ncbi:tetratricopeptide repeat protein [Methanobrevibacter thaueri]|uniref:Tetratricopeptide repeat protein n=1 Tax=Methanobrevibacter thaueri TaxID=190975 RepID=A0A315XNU8_9EURY|nr:tetratricopeptide repeat protein [Methanobrevibacter thaueri]PWB88015.1 tetratricopeptide repeat protein [Methanobrevibacter thaueri]
MKFLSRRTEKKDFKNAKILLNNCEYEKSLKIFCSLLKKEYHPFLVLWNLSIICEKINKLDWLLKIVDNLIINSKFNYCDLLIHKANILFLKKDYEGSLICSDEVLNYQNDNKWAYLYKCRSLHALDAMNDFSALINEINNSKDSFLIYNGAYFFYEIGMYDESISCLDKCLLLEPNENVWRTKGDVLHDLAKFEDSLNAYEKSLSIEPSVIAWNNKGVVYNSLRKYEKAIICFDKCFDLNESYWEAIINKTKSYFELGDLDSAEYNCKLALKISQDNCRIWSTYATVLQESGKFEESLVAYDNALSLCPDDFESILYKMRLLYVTDYDFEELLIYANKVLEIENDNSFGWVCKFKALEKLNRFDELMLAYDKAFEIFPNDEELIKDKKVRISRMNADSN